MADSVVQMGSSGSTTSGVTTLLLTSGLNWNALATSRRLGKAMPLLLWTMSCTSLVAEQRTEPIWEILLPSEFPHADGILSKTWDPLLHRDQDTA